MKCALCESPLTPSARACAVCGTPVGSRTDDKTSVSGARATDTSGGPPAGEVLAERYEIKARMGTGALVVRYRALDQESETEVMLAVVMPEVVPTRRDKDALVTALLPAVGVTGTYLPGLLDADRDGRFAFAIEPWSEGRTLREELDVRARKKSSMLPAETLTIVARLEAALAAIPGELHHGDVRAEHVRLGASPLDVKLTAPFIASALPADARVRVLRSDGEAWGRHAPESAKGMSGPAADRWGIAAIAWECLSGQKPGSGTSGDPRLDDVLRSYLAVEPAKRPVRLASLLESLARAARMEVPKLDPGAHRRPARRRPSLLPKAMPAESSDKTDVVPQAAIARPKRVDGAAAEGTQEISMDAIVESLPLRRPASARKIAGATADGTQELSLDAIVESRALRKSDSKAKADSASSTADAKKKPEARKVAGAAVEGTQEISLEAIVESRPFRPGEGTRKRPDESLDPRLVRAALEVKSEDTGPRPRKDPTPSQPVPLARPKVAEVPFVAPAIVAPSAPPARSSERPAGVLDKKHARFGAEHETTDVRGQTAVFVPPQRPPRSQSGWWLVGVALVIAAAIVGAGLWVARQRSNDARERVLQQRFETLQH